MESAHNKMLGAAIRNAAKEAHYREEESRFSSVPARWPLVVAAIERAHNTLLENIAMGTNWRGLEFRVLFIGEWAHGALRPSDLELDRIQWWAARQGLIATLAEDQRGPVVRFQIPPSPLPPHLSHVVVL